MPIDPATITALCVGIAGIIAAIFSGVASLLSVRASKQNETNVIAKVDETKQAVDKTKQAVDANTVITEAGNEKATNIAAQAAVAATQAKQVTEEKAADLDRKIDHLGQTNSTIAKQINGHTDRMLEKAESEAYLRGLMDGKNIVGLLENLLEKNRELEERMTRHKEAGQKQNAVNAEAINTLLDVATPEEVSAHLGMSVEEARVKIEAMKQDA